MEPPHLLNTTTLSFEPPPNLSATDQAPRYGSKRVYAILSHRWLPNNHDEVSYEDITAERARQKPGFSKFEGTARQARKDGYDWVWIDTCCIDKRSSAEVTEAINSMYEWYQEAGCCYAYLQDVGSTHDKPWYESEWFERGWTLQELIAPRNVWFFKSDWDPLTPSWSKHTLADELSRHTRIHADVLRGELKIQDCSIAQRMSWVARRKTSRREDMAYCLLGIFDVNMVPMYGEGRKAFSRLQKEIIKHSDDPSIFAWSFDETETETETEFSGLLAPAPKCFEGCSGTTASYTFKHQNPFAMTNRGLSIDLELTPWAMDTYLAFIDCTQTIEKDGGTKTLPIGVFLRRLVYDDQYTRVKVHNQEGLYRDDKSIHKLCHDEYEPRPMRSVQLFARSPPETLQRLPCSLTGFQIPASLLHDSGNTGRYSIPLRMPYEFEIIQFRKGLRFKQIALGFDFDFNPLCVLADSDAKTNLVNPINADDDDIEGKSYDTHDGSSVYSGGEQEKAHDGLWRLKGTRHHGLDLSISESPQRNINGPQLVVHRALSSLPWIVELRYIET